MAMRLRFNRYHRLMAFATLALPLLSQPAAALYLSPTVEGQVLLFPYYSVRNDTDTLIAITNHRDEVKALRVNILEGENGQIIQYFNLYLAPNDSWTASLTVQDEQAVLRSADTSCTVPRLVDDEGVTLAAPLALPPELNDSGRTSADRAFEGMVEVIEMGVIDTQGLGQLALFAEDETRPEGCSFLEFAWIAPDGIWFNAPQTDMAAPSGGLSGDGVIINVPLARASAFQATALNDFYRPGAEEPISLNHTPVEAQPTLGSAQPRVSQLLSADGEGNLSLVEDNWETAYQAVSAALISDLIINQYAQQAAIGGLTEWVLSFPTKGAMSVPGAVQRPFTASFDEPVIGMGDGMACEMVSLDFRSRDGDTSFPPVIFIDPLPPTHLCYAVNVISFGNSELPGSAAQNEVNDITSDLLGSRLFIDARSAIQGFNVGDAGWARVRYNGMNNGAGPELNHRLVNSISGRIYHGLPGIGFAVQAVQNRAINALFAAGFAHQRPVQVNIPL